MKKIGGARAGTAPSVTRAKGEPAPASRAGGGFSQPGPAGPRRTCGSGRSPRKHRRRISHIAWRPPTATARSPLLYKLLTLRPRHDALDLRRQVPARNLASLRSEERRVGKEGRSRGAPY